MKKDELRKLLNEFYDARKKEDECYKNAQYFICEQYGDDVFDAIEHEFGELYYDFVTPDDILETIDNLGSEG